MKQCGNMAHEVQEAKRKYHKELAERKRLHNLVQELRGNIRVYCRVRPVSSRELENGGDEGCRQCVQFPEDGISVEVRSAKKEKTFEYDQVFACDRTQEKVYAEIADLVVCVLDGYNVCIFAYGQTGLVSTSCLLAFSCRRLATGQTVLAHTLRRDAVSAPLDAVAAMPSVPLPDAAMASSTRRASMPSPSPEITHRRTQARARPTP